MYIPKKEALISIAQPCISRDFHLYFEYFDTGSQIRYKFIYIHELQVAQMDK